MAKKEAVTENRFADCEIVEQVIDRYAARVGCFGTISESLAFRTEAAARIRELTPPVSEEARERAASVVYNAMMAERLGPDVPAANRWLDRIIDALGYTPTSSESQKASKVEVPASPPVVELDADVSAEELTAVLGAHVYGDRGPFTGHPARFSVCTRAADDLTTRYRVLRIGGDQ